MDYDKYEEAKRLYETANADQRYVLESLFPELAESEYERIRKAIIGYIDHGQHYGVSNKDMIAWLEKQGEKSDEWKECDVVRHGGILALVIKGRRAMKSNGEIFTIQYPDEWVKAAPNEIEYFLNELKNVDLIT